MTSRLPVNCELKPLEFTLEEMNLEGKIYFNLENQPLLVKILLIESHRASEIHRRLANILRKEVLSEPTVYIYIRYKRTEQKGRES